MNRFKWTLLKRPFQKTLEPKRDGMNTDGVGSYETSEYLTVARSRNPTEDHNFINQNHVSIPCYPMSATQHKQWRYIKYE